MNAEKPDGVLADLEAKHGSVQRLVSPLPCPFCGSTKITVEWEECEPLDSTDTNRRWFAECAQCCCQGPFCQKEPQVIPAWNKRANRGLTVANDGILDGPSTNHPPNTSKV